MALEAWWQVTEPHRDILSGKMNEAIFAADLGDVINGKGPLEYKDARVFFQKTYITKGLQNLLENVTNRLANGTGDPVIQLQTPFGGGKTHALLALYHIIKSREAVPAIISLSSSPKSKSRVAAFVGTQPDPLKDRTPWGEIAFQLGLYSMMEESDKNRIAPGKNSLRKMLEKSGPTLILIDELLEYIVKANRAEEVKKIIPGQTLAFLQELTEVVANSSNCCLVISLPASILERYDEEAEISLQRLQKVTGRVEAIYTPVEDIELYEVVRKRLFESLGDEKARKKVVDWYFNLYQKMGNDAPNEVKEIEYRDKMTKAYPFHPELIDVLYKRWGSYPTFQRTRGVLRLLAEVIKNLSDKKIPTPLIQSSLVDMNQPSIRREFIKHIGNEFDSVVAADVGGSGCKSAKIDKEMGSEYAKYNIAQGIATTIFLNSFCGGELASITLPTIRIGVLREGIAPTIIGDAMDRLEQQLWYLHSHDNVYRFGNQANLNRIIVEKEEKVGPETVEKKMRELIESSRGDEMRVYIWPESSSDVPDDKNLKLIVLSPRNNGERGKKLANQILNNAGHSFRLYKNSIFMLMADESNLISLRKIIIRKVALEDINRDEELKGKLAKSDVELVRTKLKEQERDMPYGLLNAYRELGWASQHGNDWKDLGLPTTTASSLSGRIVNKLIESEKLLENVTPRYLFEKTFSADEKEKLVREVHEILIKTPGLSIPVNESSLISSISKYVSKGEIGLRIDEEVILGGISSPSIDDFILRKEYAKELIDNMSKTPVPVPPEEPSKNDGGGKTGGKPQLPSKGPKMIRIRTKVPYDKVHQLTTGVIIPLKAEGEVVTLTLIIEATSEEGFSKTTLNTKVKETLSQIGAVIEEWKEE